MMENLFLGKKIDDLYVEDLENFFTEVQEETSTIEFKSGDVTYEKIYPEISAFLNTNGGILIIGAPTKQKNNKKEIYKGELIPSKVIKSSFILSQKISSNIVPAGLNIKIKELNYKDGKLFIIDIPQSKYPPHQNSCDGKYYIRLESETTKAPHGLIQAMFNKRQNPDLKGAIYFNKIEEENINLLELVIKNDSIITAIKGGFIIDVFGINELKKIKHENIKSTVRKNIYLHEEKVEAYDNDGYFTYKEIFETLHKGLFLQRGFEIEYCDSNCLIHLAIWSKDTEMKTYTSVYNPQKKEILFKTEDENVNIYDLMNKYKIDRGFYEENAEA